MIKIELENKLRAALDAESRAWARVADLEDEKGPAVSRLRDEIKKHPPGSDVAVLLSWAAIQIGDLQCRVFELEDDLRRAGGELRGE